MHSCRSVHEQYACSVAVQCIRVICFYLCCPVFMSNVLVTLLLVVHYQCACSIVLSEYMTNVLVVLLSSVHDQCACSVVVQCT